MANKEMGLSTLKQLQMATYMCPSISVSYYELLASYLEAQIGLRTTLLYDSRRSGPDISREDHNYIDLAFVTTSNYIDHVDSKNSEFKLLPIGSVSLHSKKGEALGYFTDIVLHRDTNERVKDFLDLRGCSFAYSDESSVSSAKYVLLMLKQMGENASFFSNVQAGGNHVRAVELVLGKKAECAAICSLSYSQFVKQHYYLADELCLFESWGPLPPHPLIVNKKLPVPIIESISESLLRMHQTPGWNEELKKFGIVRFQKTSTDTYLDAKELLNATKPLSVGVTYY